jgi:hypothetical protein
MKKFLKRHVCFLFILGSYLPVYAVNDSIPYIEPSYKNEKKYPYLAAAEILGLNVGIWAFDLWVLNAEYAKISAKTIKKNITGSWVWDNDKIVTNLFFHPYHGSLYFNSARSNGMSFAASIPYTFAGSLMWELLMESEPPAINDLIATTVGGIILGEITHRLSTSLLDESTRGTERFFREFGAFALSPMQGVNRLIRGESWRYNPYGKKNEFPIRMAANFGLRYIAENNHLFKGRTLVILDFSLEYNDPLEDRTYKPFDHFKIHALLNLSAGQPLIGVFNAKGIMWGKLIEPLDGHKMQVGIFQHFNFYDSDPLFNGSHLLPFKMAEVASYGPGFIYQFPRDNADIEMYMGLYTSVVFLGGAYTDYYRIIDRDYNMGSGFSLNVESEIRYKDRGTFSLDFYLFRLYAWKGYPKEIDKGLDLLYINSQGDRGNTLLFCISPNLQFNIWDSLKLTLEESFYFRRTNYVEWNTIEYKTFDTKISLSYYF